MPRGPDCFVAMPFGIKPDPAGGPDLDFDHIYERAIRPGIEAAGMVPIRADFEKLGGIIHRAMFERLLLCDYAVADLSTGNPNVFYELGVRHAVRPRTTLTVAADEKRLPFDVSFLRTLVYRLDRKNRFDDATGDAFAAVICSWLVAAHARRTGRAAPPGGAFGGDGSPIEDVVDSPLFQLLGDYQPPALAHLKTDTFSERIARRHALQAEIDVAKAIGRTNAEGRSAARARLDVLLAEIEHAGEAEAAAFVDLMLAYRTIDAWDGMVATYEAMPGPLRRQVLPREQLAMALNRLAEAAASSTDPSMVVEAARHRERALKLLTDVEAQIGPNPETSGLLGRIHKSAWMAAVAARDHAAPGHLKRAIDAYRRGFHADSRDFYPGINLLTLLAAQGTPAAQAEFQRTLPVVRFAIERALARDPDDYWKHATLLELAVLAGDENAAWDHLPEARAAVREAFQPETTAKNLRIAAKARYPEQVAPWVEGVIAALVKP